MNDYPNDGDAIGVFEVSEDAQQAKAARVELNEVAASYPIMQDVLDWFDKQIEDAGHIRNIDLDAKVPSDAQVIAFRELTRRLTEKRDEMETKFKAFKRDREEQRHGTDAA